MTENVTSLKKKAHDLVQKGKHDSALKIFNLVIEQDPKDASVHNKIGDVLLKLKRDEEARHHFISSARLYCEEGLHMVSTSVCRKLLRSFPHESEAHLIMGDCFMEQDKPDQARKEYVSYLKAKPSLDLPEVARTLRSLTELDPDSPKWVVNLAKVAYRQKNETFLDFAVSVALERNLNGHEKMAAMLQKLRKELHPEPEPKPAPPPRKTEKAPAEKPAARKPAPGTTDTEAVLKNLHFDQDDLIQGGNESSEDLLGDIDQGDEPDWEEDEIQDPGPQRIGEYFVACGMLKAADVLKALDKQALEMKDSRLGDVLVAMNLVSLRQVREALSKQVADMRNRLERDPGDALGFIEMANLLLDVGDFYGAVGAYLRAAEIYRSEERDYMVFELLEGVLDICPESLSAAKEIVRIRHTIDKEGQARAFYRLAVAYLLNDSQYEAMASLEAAIDVCPEYRDAMELMNGILPEEHRETGITGVADILDDIDNVKTDSSKSILADIIMEFKTGVEASISKEDFATHFDLGIAYREMGLLREAIQEFEKVLASPDYRIKAREMLGRCTFDMRRYDEAEDHFRKGLVIANTANDENAVVGFHVNLARVYDFTGRTGHAEAEMRIAEEMNPVIARALQLE
ncbi:MAG TPA: tetratricopeptide repeat protein [Candidatus Sabulitectum sp.]|nr:tetratricopeptide repeat protein [Candidatus Sabulitectum sp.]HPF33135.1 tetratricopeptide repeat protein [Candidatus Sabulitectum sp.]HPJ28191.1 tetratricopeptide repeat protein [Candidatus Sabulitectum sp.]HPR21910.1 tetratricopeptide repeat protein [Candidatus Sabulitectum sp.]